jgi:uncharacterized protein (DUF1697 family)
MTYIAFLRAVNVGGRTVTMTRLRDLFEELELRDVRTFIQSGNVFFTAGARERGVRARAALARRIERHLSSALGFEVPTMIRTVAEVEAALALDPFKDVTVTEDIRLLVIFTSKPLPPELDLPLEAPAIGMSLLSRTAGECFVVLRILRGRVGNPSAFIEKKFGVAATARFYATTAKILRAAKESPTPSR